MDTKKIGKFISENRKRKGLTQEQLGNILGVSNKTISRWENGNYMPDLSLEYACTREKKDFYWYYDFWRISVFCCICDIR